MARKRGSIEREGENECMTPAYCARSNDIRVIIPASRECLLTLDAQDIFSPYCTLSSNAVLIKARSWVSLRRSSDAPRRRLTRSLPIHYAKSLRFIFCSFSSMKPDSARFRTRFSWESRVVTVECVRNEGKAEGGRERKSRDILSVAKLYLGCTSVRTSGPKGEQQRLWWHRHRPTLLVFALWRGSRGTSEFLCGRGQLWNRLSGSPLCYYVALASDNFLTTLSFFHPLFSSIN